MGHQKLFGCMDRAKPFFQAIKISIPSRKEFPQRRGVRSYIRIHVNRISDSCGYSVPVYEFKKDRDVLDKWVMPKPMTN